MSGASSFRVVVIGGGVAGRAAVAALPDAVLVARPGASAWHAEPGRVWVEGGGRVWAEPFDALLLCAAEPLLLAALGCAFAEGAPVLGLDGNTTAPGVFAAGRIAGARTVAEAEAQARAAVLCLTRGPLASSPAAATFAGVPPPVRLDPLALATLLEQPPGPSRDAAALAQGALLGPVRPARPVGLAALAAFSRARPLALPPQPDEGGLS